jgi:AcrR family transcriptional regulator
MPVAPISTAPAAPVGGQATDRRSRKRERSRRVILEAAREIMAGKGIDEATMAEISERADVALGSLYNHFASKEDLALAVVDAEIEELAIRIEELTADFPDPAMVFAFGVRTVIRQATSNERWRRLLGRPAVIADRFRIGFGPYATRDIRLAVEAGRYRVADVDLAWRLAVWAIIGFSTAVCDGEATPGQLDAAVVALLGIVGMDASEGRRVLATLPDPRSSTLTRSLR